jgi:hypothetical protein
MFFTFLGICCFAAVAAFQAKWKIEVCASPPRRPSRSSLAVSRSGPSQLTALCAAGLSGFALFASLFTFLISAVMFGIPFAYDK